ncbi:MAG: hypothetical protein IKI58_06515 [Oscillospiraceae bacterium]|nr:hypothetical protein [Oscillospiraceae bacterium]
MSIKDAFTKFDRYYSLCKLDRNHSVLKKCMVFGDMTLSQYCEGVRAGEYFSYGFYHINRKGRKEYMTDRRLRKMIYLCNDKKYFDVFRDKTLFNKRFAEFHKLAWINLHSCSEEEFLQFAKQYPHCFAKFSDGKQGVGARKVDFTLESPEQFFTENTGKNVLLEDLIIQHPEMSAMNPSSVNTLRVMSLRCADGKPRIMAAVLRMGRAGQSVDNFSGNGIAAAIDAKTGVICTRGIDAEFKHYVVHPDTGKQIVGFQIPHWDQLKEMVQKAALVVPEVRFVGWDFAIRENDVMLVEGNEYPGTRAWEMPSHRGLWPRLKPYIDELRAMKKQV